ncbi:transporter substrate-binding domain-containing protein [Halopseudomonas pachastrellae]|nr:transporter substrate-binding domain-containing protein [Halopseudomonas pachastrellae]
MARAWLFCLCLLLGLPAQAYNITHIRDYDEIVASGELRVALYQDFPPYSFMQGGEPAGVDVALAQGLADGLGVRLSIQWMQADETIDGDLRNHLWKGHYLRPGEVADVMLRVPYDQEFSNRRDELGLPKTSWYTCSGLISVSAGRPPLTQARSTRCPVLRSSSTTRLG